MKLKLQIGSLLHWLEPPPGVLKDIGKGVVNRLIKYTHGENEGKNEGPITTIQGKVSYVLSKVSEKGLTGIAADLTANLMSAREEIETSKCRMKELTQKRIHLTDRHNENVNEYIDLVEKYEGLEVKFQNETDDMNEQNQLQIIKLDEERKNHEAEIDELDRELAKFTEEINKKKAQSKQEFKSKESEVQKDVKDSVQSLSRRQESEQGNVLNKLSGAERVVKASRRCLVDNTISMEENMHEPSKSECE